MTLTDGFVEKSFISKRKSQIKFPPAVTVEGFDNAHTGAAMLQCKVCESSSTFKTKQK